MAPARSSMVLKPARVFPALKPARPSLVVAQVRFGAKVQVVSKDLGAAWLPLRIRSWNVDGIQATINFLREAVANTTVPFLGWDELGQASRGALFSAAHALLARQDGLVEQDYLQRYGGLLLGG